MAEAWLGLGANIGNPPAQLEEALERLDGHAQIMLGARSKLVVSAPWGKTDQNEFTNMVVGIHTSLGARDLLAACLIIENDMGRVRGEKWGPRLIDIDLIAYERLELASDELTLPHQHAHMRPFVIEPLRQIAPDTAEWILEQSDAKPDQPQPAP